MSSGFQKPITIKEAIDKISSRQYLLPAIQRKFIWTSKQVEMLFDSIMQGYPINSLMLWRISDGEIKKTYKFYSFLMNYREFFGENNEFFSTNGGPDFEAVIDGQQRLTSLYVGLRGSYAYKLPRKWLKDSEECLPVRKLYLNLSAPVRKEHDNQKYYDFRFLTRAEVKNLNKGSLDEGENATNWSEENLDKSKTDGNDKELDEKREEMNVENEKKSMKGAGEFWFEVNEILSLDSTKKVSEFLDEHNLKENDFAYETLTKLYEKIHKEELLNYYLQEEQDFDKVLDIFVRTNSGGTPLTFSDLLMSVATANWSGRDAREEVEKLVKEIHLIGTPSFVVDKDFVLKTCLVLLSENVRFQLKNFTEEQVRRFETEWDGIRESILAAFRLFQRLGFNDQTFRAKNAAIPVIYYIYNNKLAGEIASPIYRDEENRRNIGRWLTMTFMKSIFGGQTDRILVTMRKVLRENPGETFPIREMMEAFATDSTRNYHFDDKFIEGLLEAEKGSNDAFYVLRLIYPGLDYANQEVHQDHLHPAAVFLHEERLREAVPERSLKFARERRNWNSVGNLQLLNGQMNESKNDRPLEEWVLEQRRMGREVDLLVPEGTSLKIEDFEEFVRVRRQAIGEKLKGLVE